MISRLQQITELWGLTELPVFFRNVANDIYFSKINEADVVIRITPGIQRSTSEIQAELDWIHYLKSNSIDVCETLKSLQKNEIESILENDQIFHVVVFKKIQGERILEHDLTDQQMKIWATNLAKMHQLAKTYKAKKDIRKIWHQDSAYVKALTALDQTSEKIKNESLRVFEWMNKKEVLSSEFGLIHADLHSGNFFFVRDKMTIFDFDDGCFHWFLYDLTIPILSIFRDYESLNNMQKRNETIKIFFDSYFSVCDKPKNWKEDFIQFCKYRNLFVHLWLIAIQKERTLSDKMQKNFDEAIAWEAKQALSNEMENLLNLI